MLVDEEEEEYLEEEENNTESLHESSNNTHYSQASLGAFETLSKEEGSKSGSIPRPLKKSMAFHDRTALEEQVDNFKL